jgi:hypothetical protein
MYNMQCKDNEHCECDGEGVCRNKENNMYETIIKGVAEFDDKVGDGIFSPCSVHVKKEFRKHLISSHIAVLEQECLRKKGMIIARGEKDHFLEGHNCATQEDIEYLEETIKKLKAL